MATPYELFIGLRYTRANRRAGRRNGFISFISGLSVAGIALGVAALITVLSVMNGFQKEVRDRMLSVLSHVEVFGGREPVRDWPAIAEAARKHPQVVGAAPYVAGQAMLTVEDSVRGVLVRGIDPQREPQVADFASTMERGSLSSLVPGEFGVAIGRELASQLFLDVGSRLTLIAPQGTATPAGLADAPWTGADGAGSWLENGQAIAASPGAGPWVQYRLALGAANSLRTPRVKSVTLSYDRGGSQ